MVVASSIETFVLLPAVTHPTPEDAAGLRQSVLAAASNASNGGALHATVTSRGHNQADFQKQKGLPSCQEFLVVNFSPARRLSRWPDRLF